MKKILISILAAFPAAVFASGAEADRAMQLPAIDAAGIAVQAELHPGLFQTSKPAQVKSAPARGNFSMLFFDEYGDGDRMIPAELRKYGIEVVDAENEGMMTFVSYKADKQLIKLAETKEYGSANGQAMMGELAKIMAGLKASGKIIIWTSRWTEILKSGATVYYLDAPVVK